MVKPSLDGVYVSCSMLHELNNNTSNIDNIVLQIELTVSVEVVSIFDRTAIANPVDRQALPLARFFVFNSFAPYSISAPVSNVISFRLPPVYLSTLLRKTIPPAAVTKL
jgi:hypothetical protein